MSLNKKLTSLPSTHHEDFYLSTSQSTPQIRNLKIQLNQILLSMKQILKFKIKLEKRDIETIYKNQQTTFQQIWHCSQFAQLWPLLDKDKDDLLNEKQQISLLSNILVWINMKKLEFSDNKMYFQFTQMKALLQWFQCLIIDYEASLRQRKKAAVVTRNKNTKFIKQEILQKNQKEMLQRVERHHEEIKEQKIANDKHQKRQLQQQLALQESNIAKKYQPSLNLSEVKNTTLLAKLAPFKNEKKREYECTQLQKLINGQILADDQRKFKEVQRFKEREKKKLQKKQRIENETLEMRLKIKLDRTVCLLKQDQQRFEKSERIKEYQIETKTQASSNSRLNWIRNSLNAYTQREQTKKISEIMRNHSNCTQFEADIHTVNAHKSISNSSPRYSTINMELTSRLQKPSYKYEYHLLRKIQPQKFDKDEQIGLKKEKSSLVDLYNMDLTLK